MFGGGVVVTEPVPNKSNNHDPDRASEKDEALAQIRESLRGLRFGSVNIIVQDGVVIQIDRTEKRRLRGNRSSQ
jgi:hypothetical protein